MYGHLKRCSIKHGTIHLVRSDRHFFSVVLEYICGWLDSDSGYLTHEGPSIEILHTKIIFHKIPSILGIHTN